MGWGWEDDVETEMGRKAGRESRGVRVRGEGNPRGREQGKLRTKRGTEVRQEVGPGVGKRQWGQKLDDVSTPWRWVGDGDAPRRSSPKAWRGPGR